MRVVNITNDGRLVIVNKEGVHQSIDYDDLDEYIVKLQVAKEAGLQSLKAIGKVDGRRGGCLIGHILEGK